MHCHDRCGLRLCQAAMVVVESETVSFTGSVCLAATTASPSKSNQTAVPKVCVISVPISSKSPATALHLECVAENLRWLALAGDAYPGWRHEACACGLKRRGRNETPTESASAKQAIPVMILPPGFVEVLPSREFSWLTSELREQRPSPALKYVAADNLHLASCASCLRCLG